MLHRSARSRRFDRTLGTGDRGSADIALVGTYPPTRCGVASFTASLRRAVSRDATPPPAVVRVLDAPDVTAAAPEVIESLVPGDRHSVRVAAATLSRYGTVLLQHEFGLYGPDDGQAAVELVSATTAPVIVTLHTVRPDPTPAQRRIVEDLSDASARLVVLSSVARQFLGQAYQVDPANVAVIPHGATTGPAAPGAWTRRRRSPLLFTWGLLSPGKGLEWAILAADTLRRRYPRVRLIIAGKTHPKVAAREGESYRRSLESMVCHLGLERHVRFIDEFLSREAIHRLMARATAVVLPYDSTEQTSSGVLIEAVSAGVPVVATAFPQAVELEQRGAVLTVPHRSPARLAEAAALLIDHPEVWEQVVKQQRRESRDSSWEAVGARYLQLVEEVTAGAAV